MTGDPVYSNRLLKGVIDFTEARFGKVITDEVLARVGIDRLTLNDMSGFTSAELCHTIVTTTAELTGDKTIPYQAGRDFPNSIGKVGGFIIGIISPAIFMKTLSSIEHRIALKTLNRTTQIGKGRFRIEITFRDGFRERPYVCENRIGCYESAPLFFGLPYAKVEHPQCMHRGEGNCVYLVDFPEYRYLAFKRLAMGLGAGAMAALGFDLVSHGGSQGLLPAAGLLCASLVSYATYKHWAARLSLEWSLLINEGLVGQNSQLQSMNSRMVSFHSLSVALPECTDPTEAFAKVAAHLVSELGFGSCQVWQVEEASQCLRCEAAAGLSEAGHKAAFAARFGLAPNTGDAQGLLSQALEQRRTLVAEDVPAILPRVSPAAAKLIRDLGYTGLVLGPILDGSEPLGLIVAGYHRGEKVETLDRAIVQSVANNLSAVLAKGRYGSSRPERKHG